MEELPSGSMLLTGGSVPIVTGDGQLETALSLLVLVLAEVIRSYFRNRGT